MSEFIASPLAVMPSAPSGGGDSLSLPTPAPSETGSEPSALAKSFRETFSGTGDKNNYVLSGGMGEYTDTAKFTKAAPPQEFNEKGEPVHTSINADRSNPSAAGGQPGEKGQKTGEIDPKDTYKLMAQKLEAQRQEAFRKATHQSAIDNRLELKRQYDAGAIDWHSFSGGIVALNKVINNTALHKEEQVPHNDMVG